MSTAGDGHDDEEPTIPQAPPVVGPDVLDRAELLAGFAVRLIDAGALGPIGADALAEDVAGYLADCAGYSDPIDRAHYMAVIAAAVAEWLGQLGR